MSILLFTSVWRCFGDLLVALRASFPPALRIGYVDLNTLKVPEQPSACTFFMPNSEGLPYSYTIIELECHFCSGFGHLSLLEESHPFWLISFSITLSGLFYTLHFISRYLFHFEPVSSCLNVSIVLISTLHAFWVCPCHKTDCCVCVYHNRAASCYS